MRGHSSEPSGGESGGPDFGGDFFRRMVSEASDAVVTAEADGTVVYANDAVEDLLGYAPEDVTGRAFTEFVPERFRDRYEEWHQRHASGDPTTPVSDETFEVMWRTADGDERALSVSAFVHETDDRRLVTGFLREAPDWSDEGAQLREEEALVEEIFDTSPMALSVRDGDGELLRANERAAELAGMDPDEMSEAVEAGTPDEVYSLYDPDGQPRDPPVESVLRTGERIYNEEIVVERSDGDRIHLSVSAAPIYRDGELRRVISAAEDITELKQTQFELERRRDELETELSEVFTRVDDAFFALNDDWEFTYVNDEAEQLLRRTEGELLGKVIWNAFPEAEGTTFEREYRAAMETQQQASFVEYYPPLSTWFEVRAYPSETGLSVYFRDVSDRIGRERELERYETIVETVDDGIYVLSEDMEFSMVNPAMAEMTGYDREELVGSSVWTLLKTEDRDELERLIEEHDQEILAGERDAASVEVTLTTRDGDTFPAEATWVLRPTDDGYERVGVVRDITERKDRERELQDRVEQQRAVAEFSQRALEDRDLDALFDEAVELVCDVLDHDYCKVLELDPEAGHLLLRNGVGWKEGIVGSATVESEANSQAGYTLLAEEPVVVEDLDSEDRFSGPDLLTSHGVESGISTIIGSPDDPWGILGVHHTERRTYADHDVQFVQSLAHILTTAIRRKERERELERYETVTETLWDGVYALDSDERFVMVNEAFLEMTGYDREELIGEHASIVHSEEISETARDLSEQAADEPGGATIEHDLRTADGDTIPAESRFGPYRDDDKRFARTGVVRDVTERQERERELRKQNERLDAFASMLAHELRNPLEIAQIYLDMGIETVTLGDESARSFREVEQALDRIEEMIETLLVVTRRGGSAETTEAVDLGEAAEKWWESVEPDGTLAVETDRTILADRSRLGQLLENLYRNAVEHGSKSCQSETDDAEEHAGEGVTVRVGDFEGGFFVADDGPGIPAEERDQVFDPGYSTSNVGIGFGLAVVRQLAEAHGWDYAVTESEEGGARFEFSGVETPD